jgi:hypothetical protein
VSRRVPVAEPLATLRPPRVLLRQTVEPVPVVMRQTVVPAVARVRAVLVSAAQTVVWVLPVLVLVLAGRTVVRALVPVVARPVVLARVRRGAVADRETPGVLGVLAALLVRARLLLVRDVLGLGGMSRLQQGRLGLDRRPLVPRGL